MFLFALAVQLLLWAPEIHPVPVIPQERDFPGLRVTLGYQVGPGDLALDRRCSKNCSIIPTTLNDKSAAALIASSILMK